MISLRRISAPSPDILYRPNIREASAMHMNSHQGKAILALIRDGDYAHAGEEESIRLVLERIPLGQSGAILDVGCGRGGTADYIRRQGWGPLVGVDIDAASVAEASLRYPLVQFLTADVERLAEHVAGPFGLIVLFNAFYAFSNQILALKQLRSVAEESALLVLFDYTDPTGQFERREPGVARFDYWQPINMARLPGQLAQAGWDLQSAEDLSGQYLQWYRQLVGKIHSKRAAIVEQFGEAWYAFVERDYADMLVCIEQNGLGGALVLAKAKAPSSS
jgi:cyclopropane fatty-acyl-phospholipid synthase-like methyltransferase